jgi:hypothetical protein
MELRQSQHIIVHVDLQRDITGQRNITIQMVYEVLEKTGRLVSSSLGFIEKGSISPVLTATGVGIR